MKMFIAYFLLLFQIGHGQSLTFTASYDDSRNRVQFNNSKNQIITVKSTEYRLEIIVEVPSKLSKGEFDSLTLITYGTDIYKYKINSMSSGSFRGIGTAEINLVCHTQDDIIYKHSVMDSGGSIEIIKNKDNKVSGIFEGNINGFAIEGAFENINLD